MWFPDIVSQIPTHDLNFVIVLTAKNVENVVFSICWKIQWMDDWCSPVFTDNI